jgi:hypothetical protein
MTDVGGRGQKQGGDDRGHPSTICHSALFLTVSKVTFNVFGMNNSRSAVEQAVARPPADTVQVTFRIPSDWLHQADALAATMSLFGTQATRTDAFREAMARGFRALEEDAKRNSHYRVSAYDGRNHFCLFWFGADRDAAIAETKRLAKEHAGGKWTVFRAYEGDDDEPFHREMVKDGGRGRNIVRK